MDKFERKVSKSTAYKRNNKYPRTELARMHEQLEKYKVEKQQHAKAWFSYLYTSFNSNSY